MKKAFTLAQAFTLSALVGLASVGSYAYAEDDDWAIARKASCKELVEGYKTTAAAEKKVATAVKSATAGTVTTNVLGVATLAIVGFGFFTWNNSETAEENLADLRHDLDIIKTVASEKSCTLPAM